MGQTGLGVCQEGAGTDLKAGRRGCRMEVLYALRTELFLLLTKMLCTKGVHLVVAV